jgi:uncharacterized protein (DUF433 family)
MGPFDFSHRKGSMPAKSWSAPMTNHLAARVTPEPSIMMGKPAIKGTRIPVDLILRHLAAGDSEQQLLTHYPRLTIEDVRAAQVRKRPTDVCFGHTKGNSSQGN